MLKALVALLALAALLGGVPWALLDWVGAPLSGLSFDSQEDFTTALLSDAGMVALLGLALWAAWLLLVLSVLAEMVAQARGLDRSRVRLGGPVQKLAGFLVGSILFGLSSPAVASAAPALPSAPVAATADLAAGHHLAQPVYGTAFAPQEGEQSQGSVAPGDLDVVTVGRSDTAWTLAEQHLGDGSRWRDIWELNNETPQADGSVWSNPEEPVQPGWELVLPSGGGDDGSDGSGDNPVISASVSAEDGVEADVIDLLTLSPMDDDAVVESVRRTGRAVVVHEAHRSFGPAGEIIARLNEKAFFFLEAPVGRVTGYDVIVPFFAREEAYLPDSGRIAAEARRILGEE
jgi:hypothetical protein